MHICFVNTYYITIKMKFNHNYVLNLRLCNQNCSHYSSFSQFCIFACTFTHLLRILMINFYIFYVILHKLITSCILYISYKSPNILIYDSEGQILSIIISEKLKTIVVCIHNLINTQLAHAILITLWFLAQQTMILFAVQFCIYLLFISQSKTYSNS